MATDSSTQSLQGKSTPTSSWSVRTRMYSFEPKPQPESIINLRRRSISTSSNSSFNSHSNCGRGSNYGYVGDNNDVVTLSSANKPMNSVGASINSAGDNNNKTTSTHNYYYNSINNPIISCTTTTTRRRRSRSNSMSPLFSNPTTQLIERNKMDPSFPQTEDEHLYLFHERILSSQEKALLPLTHDLADWLNTTLEIPYITPSNLMEKLENGVILCQLAKLIEDKANRMASTLSTNATAATATIIKDKPKPKLKGHIHYNAPIGSFFARDNIAIFLNFCSKELGIHSNLLFETEDLVSHGEIKNVLICLLEVGRIANARFGIEPPMLITLEHQIEKEILHNTMPPTSSKRASSLNSSGGDSQHEHDGTGTETCTTTEDEDDQTKNTQVSLLSDSIDSGLHVVDDEGDHRDQRENVSRVRPIDLVLTKNNMDPLDIKVNEITKKSLGIHCHCVEEARKNFKLKKLSEGKYMINGRSVFVRLLKDVHVMVRIGGGWETLEEFLVRNDPCRNSAAAGSASSSRRGSRVLSASAASTPVGFNGGAGDFCSNNTPFKQPGFGFGGYSCGNSRHNVRGSVNNSRSNTPTPSSSSSSINTIITTRRNNRPTSSPPIMTMTTTTGIPLRTANSATNFAGYTTPINSRYYSSKRNSISN